MSETRRTTGAATTGAATTTATIGTTAPEATRVPRGAWTTLVAMTGGLSMIMLDQTVVSVALPTMSRQLALSASGQQWVVNAYVLAMAATVALGGKLGSKLGPVTTFRVGVGLFFIASALCGLAPTGSLGQGWLIAARVAQGCGAALMMPVSASIVMAAFPLAIRGRAMGVYVGISQIFLALGPLLGGTLTEWVSWRAVFWINVPVGIVALLLVRRARPANPAQPGLTISPVHTLLLMGGIGGTVYALQQSGPWGWGSPKTLVCLGVGLALTVTFVLTQLRAADPLVQVRLFRLRGFLGDVLVLFTTQFSMLAMVLFSALYSQNLLGYSPVKAGLCALAMILPLMLGAQIAGRWYDRSGVRPPLLTGLTLATVGAAQWTSMLPHIEYVSKVPGMALVGLGLGLVMSPINTDALSRVSQADRPQASGIVQTVRQLGGTLGVAVVGAVVTARLHLVPPAARVHDTAEAMTAGFAVAAAVFGLGLAAAWLLLPRGRAAAPARHPAADG
ncbi:MFS transporter [Kitasatospora sp. NBC_01287]|uniref:MFS transporter n=1 Tax=Kitasatospora sp. NBC_01287 TaxID=2903573 RepID=UPI0022561B16|nr:MFS transporter [Kitasatospora sp. NBC_01287]MCX4744632.1 MFS transporter [Kitasatospora sp. NBC_01287]